jgi:hypothetical protein
VAVRVQERMRVPPGPKIEQLRAWGAGLSADGDHELRAAGKACGVHKRDPPANWTIPWPG